ncbi:hypothetical protein [Rhodospirillum sp. A1_3_36]|uniref:hypothetical protein n=1 Tax=Rhodospirillum sp. A1_3_36 TaxID=3391666 RepID=UPI0039A71989
MTEGARAGDVVQKPNPELLKRFEDERDAAAVDRQKAEEKVRRGEEKVREAEQMRKDAHNEAVAELCRKNLLPLDTCP